LTSEIVTLTLLISRPQPGFCVKPSSFFSTLSNLLGYIVGIASILISRMKTIFHLHKTFYCSLFKRALPWKRTVKKLKKSERSIWVILVYKKVFSRPKWIILHIHIAPNCSGQIAPGKWTIQLFGSSVIRTWKTYIRLYSRGELLDGLKFQ